MSDPNQLSILNYDDLSSEAFTGDGKFIAQVARFFLPRHFAANHLEADKPALRFKLTKQGLSLADREQNRPSHFTFEDILFPNTIETSANNSSFASNDASRYNSVAQSLHTPTDVPFVRNRAPGSSTCQTSLLTTNATKRPTTYGPTQGVTSTSSSVSPQHLTTNPSRLAITSGLSQTSLNPPQQLRPTKQETQVPRNPRSQIVFIDFARLRIDANGIVQNVTRLFQNVRGFPVETKEITSISALHGIMSMYFAQTLAYYGLNIQSIYGYSAIIWSNDSHTTSWFPPVATQFEWTKIYYDIVNGSNAMDHCGGKGECHKCKNPARVLVCINEPVLFNAFLSKGLELNGRFEFLDGSSQVLKLKTERSSETLKAAYSQLQADASRGQIFRSLRGRVDPITRAHDRALGRPSTYFVDLFSHGIYIGRMPLPGILTRVFGGVLPEQISVDGRVVPTTNVSSGADTSFSRGQAAQTPISNHVVEPSPKLKRHADSPDPAKPLKRRRLVWDDERAPPRPQDRIKDSKWDEACPKPTGSTKAETDTCLTCIWYARACKGTRIGNDGKCQNCGGSKSSRKCYWQDLSRGIRTYNDARDQDPTSYKVPGNSRDGRKKRKEEQDRMAAALAAQGLRPPTPQNVSGYLPRNVSSALAYNANQSRVDFQLAEHVEKLVEAAAEDDDAAGENNPTRSLAPFFSSDHLEVSPYSAPSYRLLKDNNNNGDENMVVTRTTR